MSSHRHDVAQQVHRLVDGQGMPVTAAAQTLGLSRSWAYELLADPSGERARARRLHARTPCPACGAPITPGRDACRTHAAHARRTHTRDSVDAALRAWHDTHGWIPTSTELHPTHARRAGGAALERQQQAGINAETVRRAHGCSYLEAVRRVFGPRAVPGRPGS